MFTREKRMASRSGRKRRSTRTTAGIGSSRAQKKMSLGVIRIERNRFFEHRVDTLAQCRLEYAAHEVCDPIIVLQ